VIKEEDFEYMYNSFSEEEKEKFKESTILITGCAGFIGYYMMSFLDAYSDKLGINKIIGLDNFMLGKPAWMKRLEEKDLFQIEKFDIITDNVENVKGSEEANLIIHMASIASPIFYRKYPIETIDANVEGLRSLLDYYLEKNIKGFLFFSTSEIYGNPDDEHVPTTEEYNGKLKNRGDNYYIAACRYVCELER
jgi:UDP-glucuronate decarboxylase